MMEFRWAGVLCGSLLLCSCSAHQEEHTAENALFASVPYRGVNLAGAEFAVDSWGSGPLPGTHGTHYVYPDPAYASGYNSADYFIAKGMTVFRVPFRWERLQPSRNQPFASAELTRLVTTVTRLTGKGAYVILDPHNYARYGTSLIGSSTVPNAHFADFWSRLAAQFKSDPRVIFGLMNEPHDMPTEQWLSAANAATAAIRSTGAQNLVLVPGNAWSGAASWSESWYGTSNATAMLGFKDPGNNYAYEVHQYLDANQSGTGTSCVSSTIGSQRLAGFTSWLKANGRRGFLGELGGGSSATCLAAIDGMLKHISANPSVWLGWTYWAAGPWWGSGFPSIEPSGGKDVPQMSTLALHLKASATPDAGSPPPSSDAGAPPPSLDAGAPPPTCNAATYEAESMYRSTGGPTSGGWNLWSNGYVARSHAFTAGATKITVRAAGQRAAGVWPRMVVSVGGATIGTAYVTSTSYGSYTFSFNATAGTKEIRVAFDNDYVSRWEDRNLLLDKVTVSCGP